MAVQKSLRDGKPKQCNEVKGDVTGDDSQRQFLAQHSIATLLRHCFK